MAWCGRYGAKNGFVHTFVIENLSDFLHVHLSWIIWKIFILCINSNVKKSKANIFNWEWEPLCGQAPGLCSIAPFFIQTDCSTAREQAAKIYFQIQLPIENTNKKQTLRSIVRTQSADKHVYYTSYTLWWNTWWYLFHLTKSFLIQIYIEKKLCKILTPWYSYSSISTTNPDGNEPSQVPIHLF